ncbi:MAG: YicC/YloC family endoribonuclease [Candidatus Omnitrophota bacterium]
MTGFGRAELKSKRGLIRVEVKTTNHKFLEISARLSPHLSEFEDNLRKIISGNVRRGKVNLFVSSPDPAAFSSRLVLNEGLAKEVFHKIQRLRILLKLKDAVEKTPAEEAMVLREILHYPDVLTRDVSHSQQTLFFRDLKQAVNFALASLKRSRLLEGKALERDFLGRLSEMARSLKGVEKRIPVTEKEYRAFLQGRIKEFLKNGELDHERLTLEVALYVKNSDISEEVTRMKSHMGAMKKALKEPGELGRKIDFIGQEMYREANTMGAKSSDTNISACVIHLKSTIEKIREQAQNVE